MKTKRQIDRLIQNIEHLLQTPGNYDALVAEVEGFLKPELKPLVVELLGSRFGKISVRKGRGTASSWVHIDTEASVPIDIKRIIEDQLLKHDLCGRYFSDGGYNDSYEPCVNWGSV